MKKILRIELEQMWHADGYLIYSLLIDGKRVHSDDKDFSALRERINNVLQTVIQVGLVPMADLEINFIE